MKSKFLAVSSLTFICLYGLLAAVVILICYIADVPIIQGILASILMLILQFIISPFLTDLSMKLIYKASFDEEVPYWLREYIEDVCAEQNMKYPKIGIINDGAPNAFTYGHVKNNARIVLTRGIFDLLGEEEVKAVVGHELGHAVHYDMLLMTAAQLVPLVLYGIYEVCCRQSSESSSDSSKSSKDEGYIQIIGLIAYVLYIIAQYIILWLSRQREYYADEFSCHSTKNPNALANALVNIGFGLSVASVDDAQGRRSAASPNALGISDTKFAKSITVTAFDSDGNRSKEAIKEAMKWDMWNVWAKLYELQSTHPLISKRILRISELSPEYGQTPYIVFDCEKPESYADDFLRDLFVDILPWVGGIATLILGLSYDNDELALGAALAAVFLCSIVKFKYKRPGGSADYERRTVRSLLGEVKVSGVRGIPCELQGTIIGRGNPGCIFNEDFVIKDQTGIVFLDYNQPIQIINKIFALFRSPEYFDKIVTVKGWYRRSPTPYVEIYSYECDGVTKKIWTYGWGMAWRIGGLVLSVLLTIALLFM